MRDELQQQLFTKYPEIFERRVLPMTQTCMCWGLEVGDGWYNIVDHLCDSLTHIARKYDLKIYADQVKEKYGGLRFYYSTCYGPRWLVAGNPWYKITQAILGFQHLVYALSPRLGTSLAHRLTSLRIYRIRQEYWELDGERYHQDYRSAPKVLFSRYIDDLVSDKVSFWERVSYKICEECGKVLSTEEDCAVHSGGWITTQCAQCNPRLVDKINALKDEPKEPEELGI